MAVVPRFVSSTANVPDATGPIFVANIENTFLMGTLVLQGYYYWTHFQKSDRTALKVIATVPIFLEIGQTVLTISDAFNLFCRQWGNKEALFSVGLLWLYLPVLGALTSFWAQMFYSWRLYTLTRRIWVGGLVVMLALLRFVSGVVCGALIFPLKDVRDLGAVRIPITIWLAGTMACDVTIMVLMAYFLSRSRTGFKRTDNFIWRIIILSLETGGVCCFMTLLHLILYVGWTHHSWHLAISIPEGKLYANSLLVILNQRAELSQTVIDANDWKSTGHNRTRDNHFPLTPNSAKSFINVEVSKEIYDDIGTPRRARAFVEPDSPGFEKPMQV